MYIIRKATKDDDDQILRIYNNSILFLRNLGVDQWQNNYPNIDVVNNDINNDCLYVLTDDKFNVLEKEDILINPDVIEYDWYAIEGRRNPNNGFRLSCR